MFACLTAADLDPIELPSPDDDGEPIEVPTDAAPTPRVYLVLDDAGMRLEYDEAA